MMTLNLVNDSSKNFLNYLKREYYQKGITKENFIYATHPYFDERLAMIYNYSENNQVVFSSVGDAGPHNTHGFGQSFLGPIAENRAFVRCVRNFLKINVVAQDEIAVNPTAPKPMQKTATETTVDVSDPKALLSKLMGEKGVTFAHIKKKLEQENYTNAENFATVNDIPNIKIFELLDRIQKIKKA